MPDTEVFSKARLILSPSPWIRHAEKVDSVLESCTCLSVLWRWVWRMGGRLVFL
jgi:hypothetical protein